MLHPRQMRLVKEEEEKQIRLLEIMLKRKMADYELGNSFGLDSFWESASQTLNAQAKSDRCTAARLQDSYAIYIKQNNIERSEHYVEKARFICKNFNLKEKTPICIHIIQVIAPDITNDGVIISRHLHHVWVRADEVLEQDENEKTDINNADAENIIHLAMITNQFRPLTIKNRLSFTNNPTATDRPVIYGFNKMNHITTQSSFEEHDDEEKLLREYKALLQIKSGLYGLIVNEEKTRLTPNSYQICNFIHSSINFMSNATSPHVWYAEELAKQISSLVENGEKIDFNKEKGYFLGIETKTHKGMTLRSLSSQSRENIFNYCKSLKQRTEDLDKQLKELRANSVGANNNNSSDSENYEFYTNAANIAAIIAQASFNYNTVSGSKTIASLIAIGNAKTRKEVLKQFKGIIVESCNNENGHIIYMRAWEYVDDTERLDVAVIKELSQNFAKLCANQYGCRVILSVLAKDIKGINGIVPDIDKLHKIPEISIVTTKKLSAQRHQEIFNKLSMHMIKMMEDQTQVEIAMKTKYGCATMLLCLQDGTIAKSQNALINVANAIIRVPNSIFEHDYLTMLFIACAQKNSVFSNTYRGGLKGDLAKQKYDQQVKTHVNFKNLFIENDFSAITVFEEETFFQARMLGKKDGY